MGQMRWTDDLQGSYEEPDRIQGAQFGPDLALQDRLARRDVQRSMFKGRIAPTRAAAHATGASTDDFSTLADRGITDRSHPEIAAKVMPGLPPPADNTMWTKFGTREFFNRDELGSLQNYVYEPRVAEIRDNPAMGQNPRFPAGHEMPHIIAVANRERPRGYEGLVANGNHRVAAEMDKGALFIEGRTLINDAETQEQVANYRNTRRGRQSRISWSHEEHPPKIALKRHR